MSNPFFSSIRSNLRKYSATFFEKPIVGVMRYFNISPNMVTIGGFGLSLVAFYFISKGCFIWAGIFVLLSGLFDLLDGSLARATGNVSAWGGVLDSILDRVGESAVFLGFLIYFLSQDANTQAILVYLAFSVSMLVSYIRARGEVQGFSAKSGLMTRPERILLFALGLFTGQITIALAVILGLGVVTLLQRSFQLWKGIR